MNHEQKIQLFTKKILEKDKFQSSKNKIFFEDDIENLLINQVNFHSKEQFEHYFENDVQKKIANQYDFEKEIDEIKFLIVEAARKNRVRNIIIDSHEDNNIELLKGVNFSIKEKKGMVGELLYIYRRICSLLFYKIIFKNVNGQGLRSVMKDYKKLIDNIPFEAEERMKFLNFSLKQKVLDKQFEKISKLSEKAVELLSDTKKEEVNIHSIIPDNLGRMNKMLKKDYRKILSKYNCSIYDTEIFNNFKNTIRNSVKEAKKKRKLLCQTEKAQEKDINKNEMLNLLSAGMNISAIFDEKIVKNSVVKEGV